MNLSPNLTTMKNFDKDILISVCVPTYNQEKELPAALDGILMQEGVNFEIIIANDGSTDSTGEICEDYKRKYPDIITYINQPQNKGIVENSKDCLLAAKGKYIAVCEGDDYWVTTDKLYKQANALEHDPAISLVHTDWNNLNWPSAIIEPSGIIDRHYISEQRCGIESFLEILKDRYRGIRFSSSMFRASLFHKIIEKHPHFFDPKFTTIDIGIFYCMGFYGKLHFIPDISTVYRIHDGSVSVNSNDVKSAKFSRGVLYSKLYFLNEFASDKSHFKEIWRNSLRLLAPYVLKYSDTTMTSELKCLAQSYRLELSIGQSICFWGASRKIFKPFIMAFLKLNALFNGK